MAGDRKAADPKALENESPIVERQFLLPSTHALLTRLTDESGEAIPTGDLKTSGRFLGISWYLLETL
jgi:hypothetical protein